MDEGQQLQVILAARLEKYERDMLRARNTTDRRFREIENRTKRAGQNMEKSMEGASSRVGNILSTFGKGLAGGIIGGLSVAGINKLVADVGKVAEGVANIGSNAKRAGMNARAFQELSHVAEMNRISMDALADGMKELQLRADEFVVTGKGSAAEAFQRLGFSAKELKERLKDPSALLVEIIGRLEQLDKAAQIRIADELFGGTAGERFVELLDKGAAGIRAQIKEANDLGLVLDEGVIQRADEIDRKYKLIAKTINTELKGAVIGLASSMLDWWDSLNQIEEQQSRTIQLGLSTLYAKIQDEQKKLAELMEQSAAFPEDGNFALAIDRQKERIEELTKEAMRLRDVLDRRSGYDEGFIYGAGEEAKKTTPEVKNLNDALDDTGSAGSSAVAGIKSYADALRALKNEIPELAEQLAELDARTRIDRIYRQALQMATTPGEIHEAGVLRDSALQALASRAVREAAGKGMLDLIGHAEGTDAGRGYNETLAFGKFTGGNRNLVMMTLDQIDAMQSQKVPVCDVEWRQHWLREAQERIREASRAEETTLLSAMRGDYAPAVRFAFLTGCRRAEIVSLTWQRVDFFGKTITVTGKGSKKRILPMTQPVYDLLWGEKDNHPTAVFTYVVQATRKHLALVRGERRPITMEGFKTAWRRYKADCGVEDFRFHDTRHTAATRTLRSGNLKVVQQMLGHEDITTTAKYAHAMLDDMRTAMEAANSIPSSKPDPKEASN